MISAPHGIVWPRRWATCRPVPADPESQQRGTNLVEKPSRHPEKNAGDWAARIKYQRLSKTRGQREDGIPGHADHAARAVSAVEHYPALSVSARCI
jgi:hypothetical protein